MGNRHGRGWVWRLWVVAAAALTAVTLLLMAVTMGGARQALLREATTSAAVVGRAMVRQFDTPIRFGVPLASVVGVPEFLDEVRRSTSGIAYIVVSDVEGRVLYSSGAEMGASMPVPASPTELGPESEITPDITPLDPYLNVRWPLGDPGRALGFIHVGADERLALPFLWRVADEIVVAWLIALLAALQVTAFLAVHHLQAPVACLRRLLVAVRNRDFARAGAIGASAGGGSLLGTLRDWVRDVNARYQGLAQRIEEARASHFDPATIAEIDRVRQLVAGQFAPERGAGPMGMSRLGPRTGFALFFLVAAIELCRPFLGIEALLLAPGWSGLSPTLATAAAATALLLSGGIGIVASGWVGSPERGREGMLAGFALAVAGFALAGTVVGYGRWLLCLALAGGGLGLALGGGAAGTLGGWMETRRSAAILATPVILALICGPALGGYAVDRLGSAGIFPLAALLVAVAAALALAESRQGSAGSATAEPGSGDEAEGQGAPATVLERVAVLLALAVVGGVAFCLLPASWAAATPPPPTPQIGLVAALLGLAALGMRPLAGWLSRRLGLAQRLGLSGLVAAAGLVLGLVWLEGEPGLAIATAALGVALGLGIGNAERRGMRAIPMLPVLDRLGVGPRQSAAVALACLAAGPIAMAALITLWGMDGAALATAGASALAALGLLVQRPVARGRAGA